MAIEVRVLKNHEEAEKLMLQKAFDRTPEERLLWLLKQIELMNKLNPIKKKSSGYKLPRKNG